MKHRIKEFRDMLVMSQKEFAEVCGMQQTQITKWMIKRLFILALLLAAAYRIEVLEEQVAELKAKPAIIYQVDNAGGAMIGKVTGKAIIDGKHTLDCGVYGTFLVTKELYESVNVGDEIPEELRGGRK